MAYDSNILRLPDPGTVPAGPGFTSISLSDNTPGLIHALNNGGVVSVRFSGSYWTMQVSYHELTLAEATPLLAMLSSVSGGFGKFYVQHPLYVKPKTGAWDESSSSKIALGSISMVSGSSNRIQISNWSSRGGNFSVGDMLKFTNSHKIYQVVATSLVANTMMLTLHCDVIETSKIPTAGFEPNDIKFRVRLAEGTNLSMQFTSRGLYEGFNLSFREDIL